MRANRWLVGILLVGGLVAAGCFYHRANIERWYAKTAVGMTKVQIIKVLGPPTNILENEMFYLYDDPKNPVRLRYVLDDKDVVVAKYYETKKDLARKAEETMGQVPPPTPGEETGTYPGAPLERFQKKSGM